MVSLKLTFQLAEDAAINAVARMGGFQGSTSVSDRMATVHAHITASKFSMRCLAKDLPTVVGNYVIAEGYVLIAAEAPDGEA